MARRKKPAAVRPTRNVNSEIEARSSEESELDPQPELDRARGSELSGEHAKVRRSLERQSRVHKLDMIQRVDQIASEDG
jgi:hypothetical protein